MARRRKGGSDQDLPRRRAISDRIKLLMDANGENQSTLGRKLKINQTAVGRWFDPKRGYSLPGALVLADLAPALGVSYRYLLTGEGDKSTDGEPAEVLLRRGRLEALVGMRDSCNEQIDEANGKKPKSQLQAEQESAYRARVEQARKPEVKPVKPPSVSTEDADVLRLAKLLQRLLRDEDQGEK
jgi:transcriptional regulator with XRE-family HTH domain